MSEEILDKGVDATMSDEELELDLNLDDNEDVEALKQRLEKTEKFAKQALARAKTAESKLKAKPQITNQANQNQGIDDEVLDLRLDGYSKDEVLFISRNGGRKALEDANSFVSIALKTKRDQAKAEAEASKTADTSQMSEVERKYTPEQLKNMSAKELAEILPHA